MCVYIRNERPPPPRNGLNIGSRVVGPRLLEARDGGRVACRRVVFMPFLSKAAHAANTYTYAMTIAYHIPAFKLEPGLPKSQ